MELDELKTAVAFLGLFGILAAGTLMSPMSPTTVMMVMGGLLVFGVVTLLIGVKHGEYRASN
jgi:purine-cytosine permease-like protein